MSEITEETMTEAAKETITLEGETYDFSSISEVGQVLVRHITSITQELAQVEHRIIILKAAAVKLTDQLKDELAEI
jgi:hypothetical protein|tara:strand:- start:3470 stop:3697 length:228 start_codon:yes stop_codon:yes gene_type:complete